MNHYDTNQPRISIVSPGNADGEQRELEIGQSAAWNEAVFFARVCDYRISVSRFNGVSFVDTEYLTQGNV